MRFHTRLLIAAALLSAALPARAADPYAPLRAYQGRWSLTFADGRRLFVTNQCAKLAKAFTCEQIIDGSPADLVIFVPTESAAGRETYKTLALDYAAQTPGPLNRLTIDGAHWVYESTAMVDGHTVYRRTLNDFEGANHITFTQQRSMDGKVWETTAAGEEARLK